MSMEEVYTISTGDERTVEKILLDENLQYLHMFFADMQYLYKVFTMLLMYLSAIFYQVEVYPESVQRIFLANPIYVYIKFIRLVVLNQTLPSAEYFLMATGYAVIAFVLGMWIYHKNNQKFIFYV